jgi:hypothetical protein
LGGVRSAELRPQPTLVSTATIATANRARVAFFIAVTIPVWTPAARDGILDDAFGAILGLMGSLPAAGAEPDVLVEQVLENGTLVKVFDWRELAPDLVSGDGHFLPAVRLRGRRSQNAGARLAGKHDHGELRGLVHFEYRRTVWLWPR